MDTMKKGWFSEINDLWPGVALSLEIKEVLHSERSKYQDILVVKTKSHGTALILDNVIQCTEKDEFSYHEMIAYLPLCSHPKPENVLIVGGGDGGAAREVAKHPEVKHITLVDIDDRVIEVCRQYFPHLSLGLNNPKVNVSPGDGFEFLQHHQGEYDVIITDSSDPVGPAENLFKQQYYQLLKNALKPGGIIASQGGTVWESIDQVRSTLKHCKSVFPVATYAITAVPTYPTGQIGFILGSKDSQTNFREPLKVFSEEDLDRMEMQYYNDKIHRAAFALPRIIEKTLTAQN
ncbi:spermidine synthase [Pseudomyrmex gracilis]|uniref:spermidine synthase n=1 Tax=Pseudomyrmex gracilis TaxID=219809 RepID=UPI0009955ABD|nr:spermidine synthase [Pseudomyrmex gracilis]XP_020291289.1 spermidine synthase [Pseudomyrmex gracilis]XP_020291290.1 spermidine synthase [Pseudomyrmex gracilis]